MSIQKVIDLAISIELNLELASIRQQMERGHISPAQAHSLKTDLLARLSKRGQKTKESDRND